MGLDEVVKLGGIGFCVVALLVLNVGVLIDRAVIDRWLVTHTVLWRCAFFS